uniref:Uncharacterized protein n=1 Tax=Ixodes ricinus TaxID=34613 RepID=A0A6B0UAZ4_IXORI
MFCFGEVLSPLYVVALRRCVTGKTAMPTPPFSLHCSAPVRSEKRTQWSTRTDPEQEILCDLRVWSVFDTEIKSTSRLLKLKVLKIQTSLP